jgi:hypothetical protein
MCAPWDTACLLNEAATAASNSVLGQISQMIITAELFVIDVSASWWVLVPSIKLYPNAANTDPYAAPIDAVARIRALMLPIAAIVATGGMLWNGLLMVLSRKPAPLVNVLRGLWNTALWSAVGVFGTNLLLYGTDQFSTYILTTALRTTGEPSFAKRLASLVVPIAGPNGLVMLVGIIGLCCALMQAILMLFRDGSVLILAGSTALAASGSFTKATNGWLPTLLKWQLALIFYKPTAAIVYAVAIWLQGENRSTDPRVLFMGLAMMIVALVALPVLLRFFNWAIGGLQSGSGGFGLLATAGASGLHAASAVRGAGGGFGPGEHARYLAETFDRGSGSDPPSTGPRTNPDPTPDPGPGPGTAPPGFKPPTFHGDASQGKASNISSVGTPPTGNVTPTAAATAAAPVVSGAIVVADTAAKAAKGTADAAANAMSDATKGR